ncbi:hypothetical protein M3Y99_00549600 [Aphelenchoides fujianensis]|nr:hypothetical protein M3Y99_00549600 [Aphelenchoides fujianensis]
MRPLESPVRPLPSSPLLLLISTLPIISIVAELLPAVPKCADLPHSDFLTAQELDRACAHRKMWLADRDRGSGDLGDKLTENQLAYIESLQRRTKRPTFDEAKELRSPRLPRKIPFNSQPKSIRKELRMMSDEEREALGRAMNALKHKMIDNVSIWDLHTLIHYPDSAPGAHWGPGFLTALRNEVPGVSLPYWDSTIDEGLPQPSDSVVWTEELLGNGNGYVKTGPFRDWDTNVLMPLSPVPVKKLYRSTGGRSQDRLLSPDDVNWIVTRANFSDLTFCHDKTFESMHGLSHVWVGGFMFVIRVSPNDPTFYLHHSFIDYLWEQFRQNRQTRAQREREWARKICDSKHSFNEQMKPFNLKNRDGLSNDYTDFWYEYQPVRHCTPSQPYCDSKYYFCDNLAWKCRSKIQLGGNCTGFANMGICHNSVCIQNTCRLPATESKQSEGKETRRSGVVWAKTLLLGDGDQPLLSGAAHVVVTDTITGEQTSAALQKTSEYPELPGLVYLPLPHPRDGLLYNVSLDARDQYGRYCQSYCLNATLDRYQVREADSRASNISFTHSFNSRRFLDMDLSTHPSEWRVGSPFLVFACHRHVVDSAKIQQIANQMPPPMELTEYVWFRVNVLRKSGSAVNLEETEIEVEDLDDPHDVWISSLRRARSAYDQSVVFVRAKNPRVFRRGVSLLGWRLVGHPSEWTLRMAFLSFYC